MTTMARVMSSLAPSQALSAEEVSLSAALRRDIEVLAIEIGERNLERHPAGLRQTADFVRRRFADLGYLATSEDFVAAGTTCSNIVAELPGRDPGQPILLVGAHYDTVAGSPGANDNGSGVAAMLAMARHFAASKTDVALRFVAFCNEEGPYFGTDEMGSLVHARGCRARGEQLELMLSLETMGYFSTTAGSQMFPADELARLFPSIGNFLAFVGNANSQGLVERVLGSFRRHSEFPAEGIVLPQEIPGVAWSDHWAFWEQGFPALMATDTAMYRYKHYHTPQDTADKVDYDGLARVTLGIVHVLEEMLVR